MSRRRSPGISMKDSWVAVSQAYDDAAARNPALSTDVRLLAAARSRLEITGHSHWNRGELALVLSKLRRDPEHDAEHMVRLRRETVTAAIDRLTDAGLLMPSSWSECLVLPPFAVQIGTKDAAATECPTKPEGRALAAA